MSYNDPSTGRPVGNPGNQPANPVLPERGAPLDKFQGQRNDHAVVDPSRNVRELADAGLTETNPQGGGK